MGFEDPAYPFFQNSRLGSPERWSKWKFAYGSSTTNIKFAGHVMCVCVCILFRVTLYW